MLIWELHPTQLHSLHEWRVSLGGCAEPTTLYRVEVYGGLFMRCVPFHGALPSFKEHVLIAHSIYGDIGLCIYQAIYSITGVATFQGIVFEVILLILGD
jgi:hypothetical protein